LTAIDLTVTGDAICSTVPIANDQLANKLYVDSAIAAGGYGNVSGPSSSTGNAVARFDSTTGLMIDLYPNLIMS